MAVTWAPDLHLTSPQAWRPDQSLNLAQRILSSGPHPKPVLNVRRAEARERVGGARGGRRVNAFSMAALAALGRDGVGRLTQGSGRSCDPRAPLASLPPFSWTS